MSEMDIETTMNMLLREIKNIYHSELDAIYSKDEVDSFFYLVIEHYLDFERFVLALNPELVLTKTEEQPLFEALSQLRLQRPIQYILGSTQFMELDLKVNENVLIPRPETEELVRWILEEFGVQSSEFGVESSISKDPFTENNSSLITHHSSLKVLDIGTGSGCIAISLAKYLNNAKVFALDISEKALEVAKENAVKNEVYIEFIHADVLEIDKLNTKFDIIVSNPPYVRLLEKEKMKSNVIENEPEAALFVNDDNPLIFYRRIVDFARFNLKKNGVLYLEINQYLGEETKNLLKTYFTDIELRKDIFGNDRMLKGKTR